MLLEQRALTTYLCQERERLGLKWEVRGDRTRLPAEDGQLGLE